MLTTVISVRILETGMCLYPGTARMGCWRAVGHPRGRSSQGSFLAVWPLVSYLLLLIVCAVQQVIYFS